MGRRRDRRFPFCDPSRCGTADLCLSPKSLPSGRRSPSQFCLYNPDTVRANWEEGYLPEGIVEGHSVDHIGVLIEGEQFLARVGVPDFTSAIVTTSDELASTLVEGTVG